MNASTWITIITTILTTLTTIALAIITWRYVRLTQEYVRLTNEILKATNKPEIIMFLRGSNDSIILCIQNIGTGYASEITFTGDMAFQLPFETLGEVEPLNGMIDYLGAGQKVEAYLCSKNQVPDLPKTSFNLRISYMDSTNAEEFKLCNFEISRWQGPGLSITSPTDNIIDSLERIADNLSGSPHG